MEFLCCVRAHPANRGSRYPIARRYAIQGLWPETSRNEWWSSVVASDVDQFYNSACVFWWENLC